jgi:hypothetical protein
MRQRQFELMRQRCCNAADADRELAKIARAVATAGAFVCR